MAYICFCEIHSRYKVPDDESPIGEKEAILELPNLMGSSGCGMNPVRGGTWGIVALKIPARMSSVERLNSTGRSTNGSIPVFTSAVRIPFPLLSACIEA